jgi:hypothetical protein
MEDRECSSNFEVTYSLSESLSYAGYLCLVQNWDAPVNFKELRSLGVTSATINFTVTL